MARISLSLSPALQYGECLESPPHNVFVDVHGFDQMIENRVLHGRIFDARRIVLSQFDYLFGFFIRV